MIEQYNAMEVLVKACPSFEATWQEHLQENGNDLLYVAAGSFAHHLLFLLQSNEKSTFSAVGAAIDRLHTEGSPWVKEFATIGVLEAIQNVWANNNVNPELFRHILGAESQRWWDSLDNFWSGKAPHVGA